VTADVLPRPHCRRCDTQLANELQLGHGLCDPHIAKYQEMRAAFYTNGAELPPHGDDEPAGNRRARRSRGGAS
jgi:hypothetical protein